jgi:hypothetical protein
MPIEANKMQLSPTRTKYKYWITSLKLSNGIRENISYPLDTLLVDLLALRVDGSFNPSLEVGRDEHVYAFLWCCASGV